MKIITLVASLFLTLTAYAEVKPSTDAVLISETEVNGIITQVYAQISYSDETMMCRQTITIKKEKATDKVLSSDAIESCRRIR